MHTEFWKQNDHLEDREGDGRITLRWMLGRWDVSGTGSESCPVTEFRISSVTTIVLVSLSRESHHYSVAL